MGIMKIDKDKYISHIKDNERIIEMRRILDKVEIVINNHTVESTDFLDPYGRLLAKSILNRFMDIGYREEGGLVETERQVISIYPDYYLSSNIDVSIMALQLKTDLEDLSHRDFLGAILKLGINRTKIGDILIQEEYADIIVKREIADFILLNLERVGSKKVSITEKPLEQLTPSKVDYNEINKTLSSYRLDVYVSATYNLSRQESMSIIKSGNVKVNWEPIDKVSKELEEGDIVSIRGYGRSILHSIEGMSKKGRIKAVIRILI
jgi:RNA-binding protein YlmH